MHGKSGGHYSIDDVSSAWFERLFWGHGTYRNAESFGFKGLNCSGCMEADVATGSRLGYDPAVPRLVPT